MEKKKILKGGVVGTLMSNYGLEKFFLNEKISFKRSKVGDRYVKEMMKKNNYNLGGEQSGHIILGKFATTGDGLLVALETLFALRKGKLASEMFKVYKSVPQKLLNIQVKDKKIINSPKCKKAITNYKTIKIFNIKNIPKISLIECVLETGRTHQIRVHLKYKGTSLLGDKQYGKKNIKFKKINNEFFIKLNKLSGQALHAKTLGFIHPDTKKWMSFNSNLPNGFKKILSLLENLGRRGKEFGTVTARKRRCGWFDGVLVRQTIKISGINGIALTKLDVLDELDEIKMCVKYELKGKKIDYLPAASEDQFNIKPIYKTFPGWKTKTEGIRNLKDLPDNAKRYIHALEDFIGARISSISTSPERDDTILVEDPFNS